MIGILFSCSSNDEGELLEKNELQYSSKSTFGEIFSLTIDNGLVTPNDYNNIIVFPTIESQKQLVATLDSAVENYVNAM